MSIQFGLNAIKFEDIRSQIVTFLQSNSEFSGQFDFTSSNLGLIIDTMSYVTMLMSYQVSNTANNMFLDTTTIRKNAVSIAKTMGFRPRRTVGARITGTIHYYDATETFDTNHSIRIPALTQFVSDGGYTFVNYEDVNLTVDPYDTSLLKASVILHEGTEKSYTYLGNGVPYQTFTIPSKKVDENNFNLYVKKNNVTNTDGTKWNEVVQSFTLVDKNSYFVEEDLNTEGYVRIVFGDNEITNYPTNNEIVTVKYIETNGSIANGNRLISMSLANMEFKDKTNTKIYTILPEKFVPIASLTGMAFGGKDLETLAEIQARCPKSFATVGRAVTENDYSTLLQNIGSTYKSSSIGGDKLYPNNPAKLGNIYLTSIPSIDSIQGDIFTGTNKIYLSAIEENDIFTQLNKFRVISTQLNFIKPSYIFVVLTPTIETKPNTNQSELDLIKNNINTTLNNFFSTTFNNFAQPFRASRINGLMSDTVGVLSSTFTTDYYFALAKDSFYDVSNFENNMLYLPVITKTKDIFGNVSEYENFVKTNAEQKVIIKKDTLEHSERTIYGKITNANIDRYIYNEDVVMADGSIKTCDLMLDGTNKFFDFYRFYSDLSKVEPTSIKNFTFNVNDVVSTNPLTITPTVTADVLTGLQYDSYKLFINDNELGSIDRTRNRDFGFQGIIEQESDITATTHGNFYKIENSFAITGTNKSFTSLSKGDVIIYNATLSGDKWVKATDKGLISAETDAQLFSLIKHNSIYYIAVSGDFGGAVQTPLESGDYIIFNLDSSNPYRWEKINVNGLDSFDASIPLVKEVVPYEMKRIIGTYTGQTNFGGRSNSLSEDDLIYYDQNEPIEIDKWKLICNVALSGSINSMETIDCLPISGGSLEIFDYSDRGLAIGTAYRVINIGNFGESKGRINWPTDDDTAFDGDVILYIGNGKWNIWQDSKPDAFDIDGNTTSALPMALAYGDAFLVTVAGNFYNTSYTYAEGDLVLYTGNNTWIPVIPNQPVLGLDASSIDNLPHEATFGDIFTVYKDGNFSNSYMVRPLSGSFVQGDKIIYTGSYYTILNEYTFNYTVYNLFSTSRDYLNNIGFNYVFRYVYNFNTKKYEFYFDDIFHGKKLGTFRYNGASNTSLYDVGKILFEPYVVGNFDMNSITGTITLDTLFDDTTINKIKFLPKNKLDANGVLTTVQESNFDTVFNTFIIATHNTIGITQ